MASLTLTSSRLRIPSAWIRDLLSEILATYIFVLLSIGVVAQEITSGMERSSIFVINLSISIALMMAIYISGNASGGYVNPGIALCMCLTGRLQWRKYPLYVVSHFVGAFLAAGTVYGLYSDTMDEMDGGIRQISGVNGTGAIFTTYPHDPTLSKATAFLEIMVAHALLVICTLAFADGRNMNPSNGLVPIPIGLSVFTVCSGFSHFAGCPINPTKDLAPRLLLLAVGYGHEAFTYWDNWFWIPPVASMVGSVLATLVYQLVIDMQWEPLLEDETQDSASTSVTDPTDTVSAISNKNWFTHPSNFKTIPLNRPGINTMASPESHLIHSRLSHGNEHFRTRRHVVNGQSHWSFDGEHY